MGKHKRRRDEIVEELSERLQALEKRLRKRSRHRHSDDYESRSGSSRSRRTRTRSRSRVSDLGRHRRRSRSSRTPSRTPSRPQSPALSINSVDVTPTKDTNTKEKGGGEKEEATVPQTEDLSLSLNIEELLGAEGLPSTSTAIELHESLAKRWSAILQNGLNADTKNNIIRKYDTPKNCNLLIPPKLNEEVAAALSESAIKRDQRIGNQQTILAAAITTIGKTLNNLIASPQNESETLPQIETLSDAARLLCDIYHDNTVTRRSLILPGLNKDMKELMEQTPISEYLFGDKLQDKVNAIKAVKKSGQDLKNTPARVPLKPKNLNFRGPQRHQLPRPSGQKQKLKRNAQVTKPSTRTRRSPQRQQHHQRRRGQDRR